MIHKTIRIIVGILLPAPLGIYIFYALSTIINKGISSLSRIFVLIPFDVLLWGYMVVGIQSIIFALVMEFYVNRKIPKGLYVVLIGGVLGGLSGMPFLLETNEGWVFIKIGALTGLVLGLILRYLYINCVNKAV